MDYSRPMDGEFEDDPFGPVAPGIGDPTHVDTGDWN